MRKIRAAVIGTGSFGELHAQFYHEYPLTELVAVVNRTEARGRRVAERFGVPWYQTPEELLEKEDFELVSVCTSEQRHKHEGILMAKAGKKMLMEKPLAPTMEEIDELLKVVEENNTFMAVNYILRQDTRFLDVKRRSDNGEFGDHISYFARRRGSFAGAEYYGPWTDILISTAIHDIDLMVWYNGSRPIRVFGESITHKCRDIGTYDAVVATIKFENGAIGCIETSWVLPSTIPAPLDCSFHLVGTKGGAFIEGANSGLTVITEKAYTHPDLVHWPVLPTGLRGDLFASMESVVKSVLAGTKPFMTGPEARVSHEIVFAIRESLETHKPVDLV